MSRFVPRCVSQIKHIPEHHALRERNQTWTFSFRSGSFTITNMWQSFVEFRFVTSQGAAFENEKKRK